MGGGGFGNNEDDRHSRARDASQTPCTFPDTHCCHDSSSRLCQVSITSLIFFLQIKYSPSVKKVNKRAPSHIASRGDLHLNSNRVGL